MRIILKLILILTFIIWGPKLKAQIWPFTPMLRFGNTVYYNIDSLSDKKLTGTNIAFDKKLANRFYDVYLKKDSLGIIINDSLVYFSQRNRIEPKCYQEILFYSKRNLKNPHYEIKYLRLIDSNDSSLITKATVYKRFDDIQNTREIFEIKKTDISGVFLGPGKNDRRFISSMAIAGSLACLIIMILK
jgi:hypothetical protein